MLSLNSAISVLQCLWFTSLWPTIRHVACLPVILWKMLLYFVTLPPMRMSWIFLWPFCLWAKRRPSTVSIGPSFCVPFCLWALVPLLLAGLNFWVKLLRELNTGLLNFFWGGKKDLVAFDVVIHHREDSGFQLVSFPSLAKCIPSLPSGSSVCVFLLVSLLNFWCCNRFGVDPVFVFHTFIPCIPGFCRLSVLPCSILKTSWKNAREGSGQPVTPVGQAIAFWGGAAVVLACCTGTWLLAGTHLVYPG